MHGWSCRTSAKNSGRIIPSGARRRRVGQDAQLDWRKLMNLQNPDCHRAVAKEIGTLLGRFDWDGVNLAELYFESLEGASNPARFTPMNDDVRRAFKASAGFDPKLLFDPASAYYAAKNPQGSAKISRFPSWAWLRGCRRIGWTSSITRNLLSPISMWC